MGEHTKPQQIMKLERPILIVMSLSLLFIETAWSTCSTFPGYCKRTTVTTAGPDLFRVTTADPIFFRRKRAADRPDEFHTDKSIHPYKLLDLDSSESVEDELESWCCRCCYAPGGRGAGCGPTPPPCGNFNFNG